MKVYTMKKYLIALAASMLISTSVFAGSFGVGVSGTLFNIDADVTETTSASDTNSGSNTNSGSVSHGGVVAGSIFAEYTFDAYPVTFGIDVVPGTADVSKNIQKRTETPASGNNEGTSKDFTANAEIENLMTVYFAVPIYENFFAKIGYSEADVNTTETTVKSYGNGSIDGITYGLGFTSGNDAGLNYKFAYEAMDFDTLSLTSTSNNTVTGDIDTEGFKASLVYNF